MLDEEIGLSATDGTQRRGKGREFEERSNFPKNGLSSIVFCVGDLALCCANGKARSITRYNGMVDKKLFIVPTTKSTVRAASRG